MAKNKNNSNAVKKEDIIDEKAIADEMRSKRKWISQDAINQKITELKKEQDKKKNPVRSDVIQGQKNKEAAARYKKDVIDASLIRDEVITNSRYNVGTKGTTVYRKCKDAMVRAMNNGNDFDASLKSCTKRSNTRQHKAQLASASKAANNFVKKSITNINTPAASTVVERSDVEAEKKIKTLLHEFTIKEIRVNESIFKQLHNDIHNEDVLKDGGWKYNKSYTIKNGHKLIKKEGLMNSFAKHAGIDVSEIGMLVDEGDFDKVVTLYHGTPHNNLQGILTDSLLKPGGNGCLFGSGIYTTPDIAKAWNYTEASWQMSFNGNIRRKYILECLVRPGPTAVGNHAIKEATQFKDNNKLDTLVGFGYMSVYAGPDVEAYSFFRYSEYVCYLPAQVELVMIHEFTQGDKEELK
jgi:hypothetical protein